MKNIVTFVLASICPVLLVYLHQKAQKPFGGWGVLALEIVRLFLWCFLTARPTNSSVKIPSDREIQSYIQRKEGNDPRPSTLAMPRLPFSVPLAVGIKNIGLKQRFNSFLYEIVKMPLKGCGSNRVLISNIK